MATINLYSKRQKASRGDFPDVYIYDVIPEEFRVQVIHIWRGVLGDDDQYFHESRYGTYRAYQWITEALCREYGRFRLYPEEAGWTRNFKREISGFLLQESDFEKVLDVIELSFQYINDLTRYSAYLSRPNASSYADDAIEELNERFQEHGLGYRFEQNEIIRIDSELLHADVVKPALSLLADPLYQGAQAEFLQAHEHYRHGRAKEAIAECLKALESTMKSICEKRTWAYNPGDTSQKLIQILFDHDLVPQFWTSHFTALRSTLESGVPVGRNRLSGHGQGASIVEVPTHLVGYVLHQTASAIVFLAEAEKALP